MSDQALIDFLAAIAGDIASVDGGCPACVEDLVDAVNGQLEKMGVLYQYRRIEDGRNYGDVVLEPMVSLQEYKVQDHTPVPRFEG